MKLTNLLESIFDDDDRVPSDVRAEYNWERKRRREGWQSGFDDGDKQLDDYVLPAIEALYHLKPNFKTGWRPGEDMGWGFRDSYRGDPRGDDFEGGWEASWDGDVVGDFPLSIVDKDVLLGHEDDTIDDTNDDSRAWLALRRLFPRASASHDDIEAELQDAFYDVAGGVLTVRLQTKGSMHDSY